MRYATRPALYSSPVSYPYGHGHLFRRPRSTGRRRHCSSPLGAPHRVATRGAADAPKFRSRQVCAKPCAVAHAFSSGPTHPPRLQPKCSNAAWHRASSWRERHCSGTSPPVGFASPSRLVASTAPSVPASPAPAALALPATTTSLVPLGSTAPRSRARTGPPSPIPPSIARLLPGTPPWCPPSPTPSSPPSSPSSPSSPPSSTSGSCSISPPGGGSRPTESGPDKLGSAGKRSPPFCGFIGDACQRSAAILNASRCANSGCSDLTLATSPFMNTL
mmetsp:Transcript_28367/g.69906  ORF Transcript_28367/g.69906 Transcript_28367/m.69906 type:complete len:275 (+) Transcript_28367:145-969(+)